jgi:hypothetical protein
MWRMMAGCMAMLILPAMAYAEPPAKLADSEEKGDKLMSGMSIVGNDEAPKSLVIVPWKSSELGDTLDVSRALDDARRPVDRDVFMRELTYYQIRTGLGRAPGSGTQ